jgi:hypothetical protein
MNPNEITIQPDQLMAGDVIIFVLNGEDRLANAIRRVTRSKYTHAAICIGSNEVVDVTDVGIRKTTIQNLISQSAYGAVFRNKLVWSEVRIKALKRFLDQAIQSGSGYDFNGFRTFLSRNRDHQFALMAKIRAFFNGELQPQSHRKPNYTCSELIAACFIEVGFISPDTSIAFQSDTYSPGSLGKESNFGFLLGYLKPNTSVTIPLDDEFANNLTVKELEQAEQELLTGKTRLI